MAINHILFPFAADLLMRRPWCGLRSSSCVGKAAELYVCVCGSGRFFLLVRCAVPGRAAVLQTSQGDACQQRLSCMCHWSIVVFRDARFAAAVSDVALTTSSLFSCPSAGLGWPWFRAGRPTGTRMASESAGPGRKGRCPYFSSVSKLVLVWALACQRLSWHTPEAAKV